ncbi:spondin-1 [Bacillus rossius redtenbacheri]|uniref:spondin-1 n=1 Tax=Bacillus rossius redtenbacheri TaxID=93214 RepID=UPI002FDF0096
MLGTLLLAVLLWQGAGAARCDRRPVGISSPRQSVGVPFGVRVASLPPADQPDALPRPAGAYLPGQDYLVSLVAEQDFPVRHFTDFMLTVESPEEQPAGSFSPSSNTFTKFSERCRNAVVQTSSMPKLQVSAYWRAPPPGSGCVVFRASVVEMRSLWYMDDGPLSLQLCEEPAEDDASSAILDPCCACEEAKYEIAFEGLWSRHTHPKDFPKDHFKAKFSDVIGASHMVDYRFWNYGEFASEGLKQLAEEGSTRALESELKEKSQYIRTIIKARGIGYPNVTGKTFAVFRVDNKNHLVSVVSKIAPSPDWYVGLSGLELCLPNCSWVEKLSVELYPWDAGTDNGVSYESDDSPSIPAEPIRKITSNFPKDLLSPFYEPTGEDMKPLAKLHVTRQRLYEKESCESASGTGDEESCALRQWSPWTPCSASCGEGQRLRRRFFAHLDRARASRCTDTLVSRSTCHAAPCRDSQREDSSEACEVSEWSGWSRCSGECGHGQRTRSRHYLRAWCAEQPGAARLLDAQACGEEACEGEHGEEGENGEEGEEGENGEEGEEGEDGEEGEEDGEGEDGEEGEEGEEGGGDEDPGEDRGEERGEEDGEDDSRNYGGEDGNGNEEYTEENEENPEGQTETCPYMSEWSDWSPCSVTCGRGSRIRNRYSDEALEDMATGAGESDEDCDATTVQEEECEGERASCDPPTEEEREICLMDKDRGPCYNSEIRWFYDKETESCQQFEFGGCRGNRNKFNSKDACEQMCAGVTAEDGATTEGGPFGGLKAGNQITSEQRLGLAPPDYPFLKATREHSSVTSLTGRVLDCAVSAWSRWSACSASCGPGYKQRTRTIQVSPVNGGRACPRKLLRRKKCRAPPCDNHFVNLSLQRRYSNEMNYEDSFDNSLAKTVVSAEVPEDIPNEIQPERSTNEASKISEERSEKIGTDSFGKPPFIRILHSDEVDCELSEWTAWSSCSVTCGTNAYMQRTRSILQQPSTVGLPCGKRIEVRPCTLRPCQL